MLRHFHGFESVENITLIPTMISRGHGRLAHTKEYVVAIETMRHVLLCFIAFLLLTLNCNVEWNMVQLIGSSRKYHVCDGLGPNDVFTGYSYVAHCNGRDSCVPRNALRAFSHNGTSLSRKNIPH